MALKDGHWVYGVTEIPEPECCVFTGRDDKPLRRVRAAVSQFLVMTWNMDLMVNKYKWIYNLAIHLLNTSASFDVSFIHFSFYHYLLKFFLFDSVCIFYLYY